MGFAAFLLGGGNQSAARADLDRSAVRKEAGRKKCERSDPDQLCLALKYSVYKNRAGQPVVSMAEAIENVREIDRVWSQCKVEFEIESFDPVDPIRDELNFRPSDTGELDVIRRRLEDPDHLLLVTTGTWNRAGSLGGSGANAWTAMPGENLYGAILEKPVGRFGNIIAHELGHYLNLDHVNDAQSLMNPIIYDHSTYLSPFQCQSARWAIRNYWQKMVRN